MSTINHPAHLDLWAVSVELCRRDDDTASDVRIDAGRVLAWERTEDDEHQYAPIVLQSISYPHEAVNEPQLVFPSTVGVWLRDRTKLDDEMWFTTVSVGPDILGLLSDLASEVGPWRSDSSVSDAAQKVREFIRDLGHPL